MTNHNIQCNSNSMMFHIPATTNHPDCLEDPRPLVFDQTASTSFPIHWQPTRHHLPASRHLPRYLLDQGEHAPSPWQHALGSHNRSQPHALGAHDGLCLHALRAHIGRAAHVWLPRILNMDGFTLFLWLLREQLLHNIDCFSVDLHCSLAWSLAVVAWRGWRCKR